MYVTEFVDLVVFEPVPLYRVPVKRVAGSRCAVDDGSFRILLSFFFFFSCAFIIYNSTISIKYSVGETSIHSHSSICLQWPRCSTNGRRTTFSINPTKIYNSIKNSTRCPHTRGDTKRNKNATKQIEEKRLIKICSMDFECAMHSHISYWLLVCYMNFFFAAFQSQAMPISRDAFFPCARSLVSDAQAHTHTQIVVRVLPLPIGQK